MPSPKALSPAKFFGEEKYQQYIDELTASGTIGGETLTPDERKEGFKKRGDKIDFEKFVNKVLERKQAATVTGGGGKALPGGGGAIVRAPGGAMQKFIQSPVGDSAENILEDINSKLDDLLNTIRSEQKIEEKSVEKERQSSEREKRTAAENKLEKRFGGLKKAAEKIIAPVKGILDQIIDFFVKILFGRALYKIVEWFGNEENQGKIQTIIRFIGDFWPALTAAVLLFGTSFGGVVKGILGIVGRLTVGLLKVIPKFVKFLASPLGLALTAAAGIGALFAKMMQANQEGTAVIADPNDPGKSQMDEINQGGGMTGMPLSADMLGFNKGGLVPAFKGGGKVPGGGPNRDSVPAMLTPGEFVMSRGAVQRYGTDTLASMNAVGGGTNIPTMSRGITKAQGGGMIAEKENYSPNKSKLNKRASTIKNLTKTGATVKMPSLPKMMTETVDNFILAPIATIVNNLTGASGTPNEFNLSASKIMGGDSEMNIYHEDNRKYSIGSGQGSRRRMSVANNQVQRTPISPPTRRKPQVAFLPVPGSGGGAGAAAEPSRGASIPSFSASTPGSGPKRQTLGVG